MENCWKFFSQIYNSYNHQTGGRAGEYLKYEMKMEVVEEETDPVDLCEASMADSVKSEPKNQHSTVKSEIKREIVDSEERNNDTNQNTNQPPLNGGVEFKDKRLKYQHMMRMLYSCCLCNLQCSNLTNLDKHWVTSHPGEEISYVCCECGYKSPHKHDIKDHLKDHSLEMGLSKRCPICDKIILPNHSTEHRKYHEGIVKSLNCPHCTKTFKQESILTRHIKAIHEKSNKVKCDLCGDEVKNLQHHMQKHTKLKPYKCTECDMSFSLKGNLNSHMSTHSDERIQCDQCDVTFSSQRTLRAHYDTVHLKLFNHHCTECEAKFPTKFHLDEHMTKHTGEQPHSCKFCGKRFSKKGSLRSHEKSHFKGEQE